MDRQRLSDRATGQLVRISWPIEDWAFLPDPMPPKWESPTGSGFLELLLEAWDCLGRVDGIGSTLSDPLLLSRPLEDREALQSSKLEGTYATPEELLLFAQNPRASASERDPANAWREVFNYREALRLGLRTLEERPLTLNAVRAMHAKLMEGVRGTDKQPGEFRKQQVAIGATYRYIPPPPQHLNDQLADWERYINREELLKRERLIRSFVAHYQFEAIHPFLDGNGRIGRVVLAIMIAQGAGHRMPWLYLSPYFEKHKDEYVSRLFQISANGEWTEWIEFCLRGVIEQGTDTILRCRLLQELRKRYLGRVEGTGGKRTLRIIEGLFSNPVLSVADVCERYGVTYKTGKADIGILVRARVLRQHEGHFPAVFFADEIFGIAFADQPRLRDLPS